MSVRKQPAAYDNRLEATAGILYVRAALRPSYRRIAAAGGLQPYLRSHIDYDQILAPNFGVSRTWWRPRSTGSPVVTSGALGKVLAAEPGAIISRHPTHAFVGIGPDLQSVLASHDHTKSCFSPIKDLAEQTDCSMLLWGCVEESPGFSTVHAAQHELGLTQRHLVRLLKVWDYEAGGRYRAKIAPEVPGCSLSFGKFYAHYEADANLVRGEWDGVSWLFIRSAKRALAVERAILQEDPRFVDCRRPMCPTCRLRLY